MPPVNRNRPIKARTSESRYTLMARYTLMDFKREFRDDAACLDYLWRRRHAPDGHTATCPKCKRARRFHRLTDHPAYSCDYCGHHLHPTAGTIFHKSSTSLWLWFYAIFLMSSTRSGLSAKQLERQIGVTYKTAWRMLNLIRNELMTPDDSPLSGQVEVDESAYGGKPRATHTREGTAFERRSKQPTIMAMVERGGRVQAHVIGGRAWGFLDEQMTKHVLPSSMIFTDEWAAHTETGKRYQAHHRINHTERIYVQGNLHTNTVEGFFGNVKNGIRGTYHSTSRRWLQSYLDGFAWRYNERDNAHSMFGLLIARAAA